MEAIHEFVKAHGHDQLGVNQLGNCLFEAAIEYVSRKIDFAGRTEVRITRNGYQEGNVGLRETDDLTVDSFHLDFSPDFQTYTYVKSTGALKIAGDSPKMQGKYTVHIQGLFVPMQSNISHPERTRR